MNVQALAAARERRAAIAAGFLQSGSPAVAALDWQTLSDAPAWLALPADRLALLQRRLGALTLASEIRCWIDRPRLTAVQSAIGDFPLRELCAGAAVPLQMPVDPENPEPVDCLPAHLPDCLQNRGARLLIAAIDAGALRDATAALLGVAAPASINAELVRMLITRVWR